MSLRTKMSLGLVAIALAIAANGHATNGPATSGLATSSCQGQPPVALVKKFNIERQVPLNGILTTLQVNAPQDLFLGLLNGTLQIREKMVYSPKRDVINGTVFVVPTASPFPTPDDVLASATIIQTAKLQIAHIFLACQPFQSIMFVGTVIDSFPNPGGYGVSLTGGTVAISAGYTNDSPPQLFNTTVSLAGIAVAWSPSATGTLRIFIPSRRDDD